MVIIIIIVTIINIIVIIITIIIIYCRFDLCCVSCINTPDKSGSGSVCFSWSCMCTPAD